MNNDKHGLRIKKAADQASKTVSVQAFAAVFEAIQDEHKEIGKQLLKLVEMSTDAELRVKVSDFAKDLRR